MSVSSSLSLYQHEKVQPSFIPSAVLKNSATMIHLKVFSFFISCCICGLILVNFAVANWDESFCFASIIFQKKK